MTNFFDFTINHSEEPECPLLPSEVIKIYEKYPLNDDEEIRFRYVGKKNTCPSGWISLNTCYIKQTKIDYQIVVSVALI